MDIRDIVCIEGFGADSNSYLIYDILVDTGTGNNPQNIFSKLKEYDLEPDDIELVINTHCHYDHVGGNYLFPNAKIAIHEADADILMNNDTYLSAANLFNAEIKRTDVDIKLKDKDKIGNFEVIHTPGHSPGGICLWDGESLICGDTLFAYGGVGRMDLGGNIEDMKRSLEKLRKLDVKYLLPGHGPWTDNGKKHIELSYSSL